MIRLLFLGLVAVIVVVAMVLVLKQDDPVTTSTSNTATSTGTMSTAIVTQLMNLQAQLQQLQQDNATLSTELVALRQANQGGGAGGGQPAQQGSQATQRGVTIAPTFALTPATTNLTGLLDYTSKLGQSVYKQGCNKLTPDGEEVAMTPATTVAFIKAFENRCIIMGWNDGAQNIIKFLSAPASA